MNTKPLGGFRSIAEPLDVDDAALDRLNGELGVPTLTHSVANVRREKSREPLPAKAAPVRSSLEKLTIELPSYLMDALRRSALDERTTVRHVVMLALQKKGFKVEKSDLVPDGRRQRAKSQ
ncbi:MAG: hypothetical protein ABL901_03495 [Hyphomicrobiaceae bacterium]